MLILSKESVVMWHTQGIYQLIWKYPCIVVEFVRSSQQFCIIILMFYNNNDDVVLSKFGDNMRYMNLFSVCTGTYPRAQPRNFRRLNLQDHIDKPIAKPIYRFP